MRKRAVGYLMALVIGAVPAWGMTTGVYMRVMDAVYSRNLDELKRLRTMGVDMNSGRSDGMTPLCETVMQGDYEGYEMLLTQGASPYVYCMRQLPPDRVSAFYANQPKPHTYYTGHMVSAKPVSSWAEPAETSFDLPVLGIGEILLGGVAVGAVAAFGGGSGGGSSPTPANPYIWTAPLSLDPKSFETAEYKGSTFKSPTALNFLSKLNASDAYARGYSGFEVKRNKDGSLIGSGEEAISSEKVKVAVIDEGIWTEHPDLKDNILTSTGTTYNFVYGPCKEGTTGKCWTYNAENSTAYLLPGVGQDPTIATRKIAADDWAFYLEHYKDYSYVASDATPTTYLAWTGISKEDKTVYLPRFCSGDTWYVMYNADTYIVNCDDDDDEACLKGSFTDSDGKEHDLGTGTDYLNHGTHVAGLIAAEKNDEGMMGVAYNANIIPIKADLEMNYGVNLISEAVDLGADIVNLSLGTGNAAHNTVQNFNYNMGVYPDILDGYRSAAAADKILVFAAGNYDEGRQANSSMWSLAPLSDYLNGKTDKRYDLKNLFVNVVAMKDDLSDLTWYSARCGDTMSYCVGAPGGVKDNIYSTVNTADGYDYEGMKGTSMATPLVSGALAVIKGAFPHLTNQQVVQILFETADYIEPTEAQKEGTGEYVVAQDELGKYNSVFGRGVVNLNAATDPIGLQNIVFSTNATDSGANAATSSAVIPPVFSGVVRALPAKMIVLDKYHRAFQVPTQSFVNVAKRENKTEARFKSFMSGNEKVVANTDTFRMAYSERHSKLHSQMEQGSVSFELKPTPKWSFKSFYSENTETSGGTYFERVMASPYAKMKEAWGGAVSYQLGKNWKATVLGQVGKNGFVNEDELKDMDHNRSSVFQSTLEYGGLKRIGLKMVAGIANEQASVLGMWGRGAFKTGNSKTAYVGAGVTFNLTDALTIEGMYYSGTTRVDQQTSLMKMSNLRSDSFAVTAAWKVNDSRTIGMQFVSPLRVRRGTATVDLPTSRDAYQDVVYRDAVTASLKPTAREYDVGFYYADAIREDVHFQSELGVRLNPDHVAGAAPDWRALVGLRFGL